MIKAIGLDKAVGRLQRLRAQAPAAVRRAVNYGRQAAKLRDIAQGVIFVSVEFDESYLIPMMLRTITGRDLPEGFLAEMSSRPYPSEDPKFIEMEPQFFLRSLPDELILEWVRLFKRKDERDTREDGSMMTDEEIALRVRSAVQARPELWENSEDASGLAKFAGLGGLGIDAERAGAILIAILHAWGDHLRMVLPRQVLAELRKIN
jgi:hypothetical protein